MLSILLIGEYQVHGLAWANVLAAIIQTGYLAIRLEEIPFQALGLKQPIRLPSILLSTGLMSGVLLFANQNILVSSNKIESTLYLIAVIPFGVFIYGISLLIFGFPELKFGKILRKESNSAKR